MTALQTILLGTPPSGSDGDAVRTASTKFNSNVAVLQSQAALSSGPLLTSAQTLTTAHIGKRINISLATAGVIAMPLASGCGADSVILLRNIGATVVTLAPFATSGDTVSLSKLNPGEVALMDVDGVHTWSVLMRGRTNSDNEIVNGNCTVNGNETISGNLTVNGNTTLNNDTVLSYVAGNQRGVNWSVGANARFRFYTSGGAETGSNAGSDFMLARYADSGAYLDTPLTVTRATGVFSFTQRPVFAGKTPWDTGNFNPAAYATLAGPVFTTSISTNISGTGTSAFHAVGDFGAGFAGWSTTSSAVVQIDAPAAGASYLGMRWTRNGGRHFAGIFGYEGGSGTSAPIIAFLTGTDSAPGFTFSQGGNGSYTGSWSATSDYRVKTNVVAIDPADAITRLCRTRPVEYDRIETAHSGKRFSGFIAHELQEEFPLSVHGTKDAIKDELATSLSGPQRPPKKIPDLQSVDYTSQIPYQTASIQYLYTQLQAALARIDALEAK